MDCEKETWNSKLLTCLSMMMMEFLLIKILEEKHIQIMGGVVRSNLYTINRKKIHRLRNYKKENIELEFTLLYLNICLKL